MIKFIFEADEAGADIMKIESAQVSLNEDATIQDICDALLRFLPAAGYCIDQLRDMIVYEQGSPNPISASTSKITYSDCSYCQLSSGDE